MSTGLPLEEVDDGKTRVDPVSPVPQARPADTVPIGGAFGPYRIESEIGRGATGVVYRASHVKLKKRVALKVLLAGVLASDDARRRFLREAEAAGALKHPNVVPVLDVGEHEGRHYLTMEHVEGKPLSIHLRVPQDRRGLVALFVKICDAVHHAHVNGIIHRDLKPDNVLVDAQGEPHVLDFGLAKRITEEQDADRTAEGHVLGTLRYMPPEQAGGRNQEVDVRSDVYALGTILFELVTAGRTPFEGNVRELLHQILFEQPRRPSLHRADIPWELDAICLKALEKERDGRYQSALELARDVERWLAGRPIEARRATLGYRARKWVGRNKRRAALYAALLLAVVVSFGLALARQVARETERRESVVSNARLGWNQFAARRYDVAVRAFEAAHFVARDEDRLVLPLDDVAFIPSDAIDVANPRVTRESLQAWISLTSSRMGESRVGLLMEEGAKHLRAGRLDEARTAAEAALVVSPRDPVVAAFAREVARALVDFGRGRLGAKDANAAREAFSRALVLDRSSDEPARGIEEATRLALLLEEERRHVRDRESAVRLVKQARAALAATPPRLEEAHRAFVQALGFNGQNKDAQEGLAVAERLLAGERARVEAALALERNRAEATRLATLGRQALENRFVDDARAWFLQALAFDGRNAAATEGLAAAARLAQQDETKKQSSERAREALKTLVEARERLDAARRRAKRGESRGDVRAGYFAALQAFDKVIAVALEGSRELQCAKDEKAITANELARIAKEESNYGLAEYLLIIAGGDGAEDTLSTAPVDPMLSVREADATTVQRAFREPVEFESSEPWFRALRDEVIAPHGQRFRLVVEVLSRVETTSPPTVYFDGFRVKVEDRSKNVSTASEKVALEGGPYQRVVVARSSGRAVLPFSRAIGFPGDKDSGLAKRVEDVVKGHVERLLR